MLSVPRCGGEPRQGHRGPAAPVRVGRGAQDPVQGPARRGERVSARSVIEPKSALRLLAAAAASVSSLPSTARPRVRAELAGAPLKVGYGRKPSLLVLSLVRAAVGEPALQFAGRRQNAHPPDCLPVPIWPEGSGAKRVHPARHVRRRHWSRSLALSDGLSRVVRDSGRKRQRLPGAVTGPARYLGVEPGRATGSLVELHTPARRLPGTQWQRPAVSRSPPGRVQGRTLARDEPFCSRANLAPGRPPPRQGLSTSRDRPTLRFRGQRLGRASMLELTWACRCTCPIQKL